VCEEVVTANSLDFIRKGSLTHVGPAMDRDFNFSSCIHCGQCVMMCPTGALHEKHNIAEVQDFLNNPEIVKVIQYSPLVASGIAQELGIRFNRDFDRILNSMLRRIGFDKVFLTGTGTDICISELAYRLSDNIEKGTGKPLYISVCPAWVKFAEQFHPGILPNLSTIKSPQQITGALIKTLIANQAGIKPEKIFSVSATPCMAMKFEARRDGMMRKGISDVDSVMTVRELARLIRLYGIDVSNIESEPADEPMAGRSSAASLAEVSGGMAEAVVRTAHFMKYGKETDKQVFKRLRAGGPFREISVLFEGKEVSIAVIDGLTGLAKLKASIETGKQYDLIEVMTCPGGCINGAGLPFSFSGADRKSRIKMIYQADEVDAVNLPCKSPLLNDLYNKFINENKEIADKKIFHTHFERRNVLL